MLPQLERIALEVMTALVSLGVSIYLIRNHRARAVGLGIATLVTSSAMILYYCAAVREPSHGIAILILPIATGWLWWRRQNTGRPTASPLAFILCQGLFCLLYVTLVWLQER
jgi:hypothetical protein